MDILLFSLTTVAPIFLLILLGYYLKHRQIVNPEFIKVANKISYKILIPLMVFKVVYETNLNNPLETRFLFIMVGLLLAFIMIMMIIIKFISYDSPTKGSLIQATFRSNFALFGIALALNIYGSASITAILLATIVPIFNLVAVIILAIYGEGKMSYQKIILNIITNPIIIATFIGLLLNYFSVSITIILYKPLSDLALMATPLALLALGANFQFRAIKDSLRPIILGNIVKLIIYPIFILGILIALDYRGEYLVAALAMSGPPVAISSYAMAEQARCDANLAGNMIVTTSIFSSITLFIIIIILKSFNLI